MRGALRDLRCGARTPRPIVPCRWRLRTFHGPRFWSVDGAREPFTLDRVVMISLARVFWLERRAL